MESEVGWAGLGWVDGSRDGGVTVRGLRVTVVFWEGKDTGEGY